MTELSAIFSRLGLEQYLDSFVTEGFETWKTVLDITESDLYGCLSQLFHVQLANQFSDVLGVKLGHRRVRSQSSITSSLNGLRGGSKHGSTRAESVQRLQREIANWRTYDAHYHSPSPSAESRIGTFDVTGHHGTNDVRAPGGIGGKRKYQRHPKVSDRELDDMEESGLRMESPTCQKNVLTAICHRAGR